MIISVYYMHFENPFLAILNETIRYTELLYSTLNSKIEFLDMCIISLWLPTKIICAGNLEYQLFHSFFPSNHINQ